MGNLTISGKHGQHRSQVQNQVEEQSVGNVQAVVLEKFNAHSGDSELRREVQERLQALDDELGTHEDECGQPEHSYQDGRSPGGVHMSGPQRVTDGIVPGIRGVVVMRLHIQEEQSGTGQHKE